MIKRKLDNISKGKIEVGYRMKFPKWNWFYFFIKISIYTECDKLSFVMFNEKDKIDLKSGFK